MLTAIFDNGISVTNPKDATVNSVEVHQNSKGEFELRYSGSTLSTHTDINEANQIAANVSRSLGPGSGETYGQRYKRTTDFEARHIAQDLLAMNGKDEQITAHDEGMIASLERPNDEAERRYHEAVLQSREERHLEAIGQILTF